jgi:DNA-binding FadR family transcriptional regulator
MFNADEVRIPKAAELVARRIRRAIMIGDLKHGESLPPETQLMAEFQVSRPTIREGIRVLESQGLITVSRGARGGAKVTRPDTGIVSTAVAMVLQARGATIRDLYEALKLIEPRAARLAAERRSKGVAEMLRAHVEQEMDVITDVVAVTRGIAEFHELLVSQCGNETLATLAIALKDVFEKALLVAQSYVSPEGGAAHAASLRQGLHSQMKLVELIEAGDAPGAEAHWIEHMEKAGQVLLRNVGAKGVIELFR